MIELYKFGPAFGLRETGPFVLKVMAYMRLAGIPFTDVVQGDPRKAPKKKIPYISDEGEEIGDSTFIIKHLKTKFGDPLAEGHSVEDLAKGHAIKVMLEERTYWAGMIYPRWVKTDHHQLLADTFFAEIPGFIRMPVFRMIAKGVAKSATGITVRLKFSTWVWMILKRWKRSWAIRILCWAQNPQRSMPRHMPSSTG